MICEMTKEKRPSLEEIVANYGFTLWLTAYSAQGKSYQYMDFDRINVIINE